METPLIIKLRSKLVKQTTESGKLSMSINREITLTKANDSEYEFLATIAMEGVEYEGTIKYYDDKMLGKFHFGEFNHVLSKLPNPNSETSIIKNTIRDIVRQYIKDNYKIS